MENKNYKILKWSVIILVILNITLMINTWMKPVRHGPPRMEGGPKEMIIKELEFSDAQIVKYTEMVDAHRKEMRDLEESGREIRENYFKLMTSDTLDRKAKEELELAIAGNQKEIETITFDHFRLVRNLCNEDQRKKFDSIIGNVLKNMRGSRPPHRKP